MHGDGGPKRYIDLAAHQGKIENRKKKKKKEEKNPNGFRVNRRMVSLESANQSHRPYSVGWTMMVERVWCDKWSGSAQTGELVKAKRKEVGKREEDMYRGNGNEVHKLE